MIRLKKLKTEDLPKLKELFSVNYPKHLNSLSIIQVFIDRIKKYPEWDAKIDFLVDADDKWKINGAFILVLESIRIYFDTIETSPYPALKNALMSLQLNEIITFINISDRLRELLIDVIRIQHFEILQDIGTKAFRFRKEELENLEIDSRVPDGFEFKQVDIKDASFINSIWSGKHQDSENFIRKLIQFNPSLGLYNGDELVAAFLNFDSGAIAVAMSNEKYSGNGYATLVFFKLAKMMTKSLNRDIHFETVHGNRFIEARFREISELYDTNTWITAKKTPKLQATPTWGRL